MIILAVNCGFACIFYRNTELSRPKKFETLWEAKWLATLDASRQRMLSTAIGRMPPSFIIRAVRLAEKNRIRAKSLILPLRKVLTREVRLQVR